MAVKTSSALLNTHVFNPIMLAAPPCARLQKLRGTQSAKTTVRSKAYWCIFTRVSTNKITQL